MDYLIRFVQLHETFRKPEIEALAEYTRIQLDWVLHCEDSPFAIIRIPNTVNAEAAVKSLISRSVLAYAVYELWGSGIDYASLHQDVRHRTEPILQEYRHGSFRFEVDSFQSSQTMAEQRSIVESFSYTGFQGPVRMKNPENQFVVFEDHDLNVAIPKKIHLGRFIADGGRSAIAKYSLKKRKYIATTSMDAELSLITANLALAGPGTLCYDPFMATGSFPLSCAHFGASVFGSDLDGRTVRGKPGRNVKSNFEQYDTMALYLGGIVADLTNTPLRTGRYLDAILCDPPYGVREGLKVLGSAKPALKDEILLTDGTPAHLSDSYLPPKKPYSFTRMLDDILDFGANILVNNGRLCMWMPIAGVTADDEQPVGAENEETEFAVPQHPQLEVVSECTQHFNKWSRRLLTYRRLNDPDVDQSALVVYKTARLAIAENKQIGRSTASELNLFRKKYFQGFLDPALPRKHEKLPYVP